MALLIPENGTVVVEGPTGHMEIVYVGVLGTFLRQGNFVSCQWFRALLDTRKWYVGGLGQYVTQGNDTLVVQGSTKNY